MEARDLASNLEFWSGRARHGGAGEEPPRRPRSRRSWPGSRGRKRPVAAALLLAGLTAAWLVAGHSSGSSGALDASPDFTALNGPPLAPSSTAATTVLPTTTVPATTTTVPTVAGCRGLSSARSEVRCVIDAIDLDVRRLAPGTVAAAYRHATDAAPAARSGPAACARGVPDERSWSVAAAPAVAIGRYLCRFENGRAAMWWTDGDRLVHAIAPDGDLAKLFSWWRAHPSE